MDHASAPFKSAYGSGLFHCFSWGPHEEDNVLALVAGPPGGDVPLVRVQSACYTAEIFRSTHCDCHEQLDESLRRVHTEGGAVVYMLCDGRGAGLLTKVRGLALTASHGMDTADAYQHLGAELDPRPPRLQPRCTGVGRTWTDRRPAADQQPSEVGWAACRGHKRRARAPAHRADRRLAPVPCGQAA
jgi:hypothetical protein